MGHLIYAAITSLDGYVADAAGRFDWAAPDEEVHAFVNDLERGIGTALYGRRMYEVMRAWQTMGLDDDESAAGTPGAAIERDFAQLWRGQDKVVYSTTLAHVDTPRTRLERAFEPAAVAALVRESSRDWSIGGPTLARHALWAGLVDEVHQLLTPVLVGGGTPCFPSGVSGRWTLLDERRFDSGVVHLHYTRAKGVG
jgi:dihydrofolate reductase